MKARLVFHLTEDQLLATVAGDAPATSWSRLSTLLRRKGPPPTQSVGSVALQLALAGDDLSVRLEQAVVELKARGAVVDGAHLEVRLGLRFTHIGLLALSASAATLSAQTRDTYVSAWVKEALHLNPPDHVVRHQSLARAHKLLVSCVRRDVFDAFVDLAKVHGMRFVSCRPAVMSAWNAHSAHVGTLVWTESTGERTRGSRVQLLRIEKGQPTASWRGWLPPSSPTGSSDSSLEGAIRRFQLHHGAANDKVPQRLHWPTDGGEGAANC